MRKEEEKIETKKTTTTNMIPPSSPNVTNNEEQIRNQEEIMERIKQAQQNPPSKPPSSRIKHEWIQTEDKVNVTVYIRNVKKEDCKIQINPTSLEVNINLGESEYVLDLELCDEINPNQSRYNILSTKIEIDLKKVNSARWPSLEKSESSEPQQWGSINTVSEEAPKKKTAKDWDKLSRDIEKDTKDDGNLNTFFQEIFKGGDEDQRRAIEKSFYESGGTVLSTNWSEVGKGKVEGSPPKGLEMKNYKDDQ